MLPHLIEIGSFYIPSYGLLVATAFLAGVWLAGRLARQSGLNHESVINLAVYGALAGVAGAKLLMVIVDFRSYLEHPGDLFSLATLQAAGIFYGGLLGAILVAWFYMRARKLPVWRTMDAFAPAIALGHGIGRLGCFAAGCCWGAETRLPWGVTFHSPEAARFGTPLGVPLHPAQLYESFGAFAIFALLMWRWRKPRADGQIIGLYLVLYAILRFAAEFVRFQQEPPPFGGPLSDDQWISLGIFLFGAWLVASRRRVPQKVRSGYTAD